MVDIVQLVERQIVDLVVVGSSPSIHPIRKHHNTEWCFLFLNTILCYLKFLGTICEIFLDYLMLKDKKQQSLLDCCIFVI